MPTIPSLAALVRALQASPAILQKQEIQAAAKTLGQFARGRNGQPILLGDDCAAIAEGEGYLLLAAEGLVPELVAQEPWFAGWCAVMVNVSDIAAMGGVPLAVVDALWSPSPQSAHLLWVGMQAAAAAYGVPIVGGHSNCHSPYTGLAVSILGRAQRLITSFDAKPGDTLLMAVNLAGAYFHHYPFWNAATASDPDLLQRQLYLLPTLAQSGLCQAGKDISMGGLAGTLVMLAEASGCGALLRIDQIPKPPKVPLEKWLTSFPSFGFLLSVAPERVAQVQALFHTQQITCAPIGQITPGSQIIFQKGEGANIEQSLFWDLSQPLTGFGSSAKRTDYFEKNLKPLH